MSRLATLRKQHPNVSASALLLLLRGIYVHYEVEGTRAPTGPIIQLIGRPDWESDTVCGERVATNLVTRVEGGATCPDCIKEHSK